MGQLLTLYRTILKLAGQLLIRSNLDKFLLYVMNPKLTIFMYHGVTRTPRKYGVVANFDGKHVFFKTFDKQLQYINSRFKVISLNRALGCVINRRKLPKNAAVLTFDDGYANNYTNALLILKKNNLTGTIFLMTECIGNKIPTWPDIVEIIVSKTKENKLSLKDFGLDGEFNLRNYAEKTLAIAKIKSICCTLERKRLFKFMKYLGRKLNVTKYVTFDDYLILNKPQIFSLLNEGMEVGSHSLTHATLTAQSEKIIMDELISSKSKLEKITGKKINVFSYPHGNYDNRVLDCIKKTEYDGAVIVKHGFNNSASINQFLLERIPVHDELTTPLFALNLFIPLNKIDKLFFGNYLIIKQFIKRLRQMQVIFRHG